MRAPCGCSGRLAGCLAATRCGSWGLVMARGDWVVLRGPLGGLGSARGLSCGDSLWLVGARVGSRLSCGCLLGSVLWGLAAGWCLAVLGGSGRLAVTCGDSRWLAAARCGFQGLAVGWGHFATRVVGSLGRLVTACGACGRVEIPGDLLGFCWLLCWLVATRSWRLVATRGDSWGVLVATRGGFSWRLVATRSDSWGGSRGLVLVLFPYWVSPPWPCLGFGPRPGVRGVSCRCLASCLFLVVLLGVVSRLDYGVPAASGLGRGLLLLSWVWLCPVRVASWSCSCPGLSLDFVRSWVVLGRVASCLLHRLRLRGRSLPCSLWLSRLVLPCWPAAGTLLACVWN